MAFQATIEVARTVGANARVTFRGNRYSTPPDLAGSDVLLRHRLNSGTVEIHSFAGTLLVAHRLAPAGAGAIVRTAAHRDAALETAVLSAFTTGPGRVTAKPADLARPPSWQEVPDLGGALQTQ